MAQFYTQFAWRGALRPIDREVLQDYTDLIEGEAIEGDDLILGDRPVGRRLQSFGIAPTLKNLMQFLGIHDIFEIETAARIEILHEEHVIVESDESGNEEIAANLIRLLFTNNLPSILDYAHTCSDPRVDGFSGGAILIKADGLESFCPHAMVRQRLAETQDKKDKN